jgi:hypothetical protein
MITQDDIEKLDFEQISASGKYLDYKKELPHKTITLSFDCLSSVLLIYDDSANILYNGKPDSKDSLKRIIESVSKI